MKHSKIMKIRTTGFQKWRRLVGLILILSLATGSDSSFATGSGSYDWTSWTAWRISDCFEGISYRYRQRNSTDDNKNYVEMEVKNRYKAGVSVRAFVATDPSKDPMYRMEIAPGDTKTLEQFVDKGPTVYLLLADLRFAGAKYGDPFYDCDR